MQVANVNVPVRITGRHVQATEAIKRYAESKIDNLHLDYPRIIEAHVILDVVKHRHRAEIILHCANHITIEADVECEDMYAAIDGVIAKITRQMRKYKTKMLRSHRPRRRRPHCWLAARWRSPQPCRRNAGAACRRARPNGDAGR